MKNIISHELRSFKEDLNVEDITKKDIVAKMNDIERELNLIREKKLDRSISNLDFFTNYYSKIYNLKLLSRFELASKIIKSKDIKETSIRRKGYALDYDDENIWTPQYKKIVYEGYIIQEFSDEEEIELSKDKICELVKTRKLVLNPGYKTIDLEKEEGEQIDSFEKQKIKTLPYISNSVFKDYDITLLDLNYPDMLRLMRTNLSNKKLELDINNFREVFLDDLYTKVYQKVYFHDQKLKKFEKLEQDFFDLNEEQLKIKDFKKKTLAAKRKTK